MLFLLAFPPYGLWPLAWFGLVPSLLARYKVFPTKWASLAARDTDITGSQLTLVSDVTLGSGKTPYTVLGDDLGWASLAAYVGFMILQSVVERRAKIT